VPICGCSQETIYLVLLILKKIGQYDLYPIQETFTKYIKSWLKYLEMVIMPDVSHVYQMQHELLEKAISEQE
jgi:hypothetical protein